MIAGVTMPRFAAPGCGARRLRNACPAETLRRRIAIGVTWAAALSVTSVSSCREAGEVTVPEVAPPAAEARALEVPDGRRLAEALKGARVVAETTAVMERAGRSIVMRDERRLSRTAGGDFEVAVRRVHAGAEAGDTDERIAALRVGDAYWTRGNAGPWVAWDDAVDEPEAAAGNAFSATRDMMDLVRQCGRISGGDGVQTVVAVSADCVVNSAPDGAGWTGRVLAMAGSLTWSGGLLTGADLRMRVRIAAGAGGGEVALEHLYRAEALPPENEPVAPPAEQTISSRRDRPTRMVRTIFQGWEDALGPGAPAPAGSRR